jgi:hypothetical protein
MSYEIVGNDVICQNDTAKMKLEVWIGDKGFGIYRCPECNLTYDVREYEFLMEDHND